MRRRRRGRFLLRERISPTRVREGVRCRRRLARRAPGARVARQLPAQDPHHPAPRRPILRPGDVTRDGPQTHRVRRRRGLQRHVLPLQRRREGRADRRGRPLHGCGVEHHRRGCRIRTRARGAHRPKQHTVGVDQRRVRRGVQRRVPGSSPVDQVRRAGR